MKNPAAVALGRSGGLKSSAAKRKANRKKIIRYWADVRAGKRPAPKHGKEK